MKTLTQIEEELKKEIENRKREIINEHKQILKQLKKDEDSKYAKLQLKDELKSDYQIEIAQSNLKLLKEIKGMIKNLKLKFKDINEYSDASYWVEELLGENKDAGGKGE